MLSRERQERILLKLSAEGRVIASELAIDFGVSEDVIRRDLRLMAFQGLCRRVYGGALMPTPDDRNISLRSREGLESKKALSRCVSAHLAAKQTIFIDASSTNIEVAAGLPAEVELTVVTNAPAVALALAGHYSCTTIVLGGLFNPSKGACFGDETLREVRKIHIDTLILGACGVDKTFGLSAYIPEEAEFKRCLIAQSSRIIVPVTVNKVGIAAPFKLADTREIDVLVLEKDVSESQISDFESLGVQVEIAI